MFIKKLALAVFSVLLFTMSQLSICCHVSAGGSELPHSYSPAALIFASYAANEALAEIWAGEAQLPYVRCSAKLSFRAPDGDIKELSDALLLHSGKVEKLYTVYVNSVAMGHVESADALKDTLTRNIYIQMPNEAVMGSYSGELRFEQGYTRAGTAQSCADMVMLISGAAPVFYYSEEGRLV